MSKNAEKETSESKSSRDIILSRYQNVKNLLVTKNKFPAINLPPKPVEKVQSPKYYSNRVSIPDEDDTRLNDLITLCSQIQNKIKEKINPKHTILFDILKKPSVNLSYFEIASLEFEIMVKPAVECLMKVEKTQKFEIKPLQKPRVFGLYCEMTTKSFKVVNRVYQIIEFREEKKEDQLKKPASPPRKPEKRPILSQISVFESSIRPVSPISSMSQSRSKSPISRNMITDEVLEASFQSVPKPALVTSPKNIVSFDQFMSNEKYSRVPTNTAQNQKITKQAQLMQFKQKAKEKEILMLKRKNSVIKIQALFRGHCQRKKFLPVWERHKRKQKLEKLRKIAARIKASFAPYIILKALKKWVVYRRLEKQKIMHLFQEYSAVYIQKIWRGFQIRQIFRPELEYRLGAKSRILGLLRGWKIRRILQSREIRNLKAGIKDLLVLMEELTQPGQTQALLAQVSNQLPVMKAKFIQTVNRLYRTGNWTKGVPSIQNSVLESFVHHENSTILGLSPVKSREEVPVKSIQFNPDEMEVVECQNAKKKFTNFLRRGQNSKYNPKPNAAKPKPPPSDLDSLDKSDIPQEFSDNDLESPKEEVQIFKPKHPQVKNLNIKKIKEPEYEEENQDIINELENKPKVQHNFLKRKSQTYKPTKVEWKVKSRINCWGETATPEPKKKQKKKQNLPISQITFSRVMELESIFTHLSKKHVSVSEHFGVENRTKIKSIVPQFVPDSFFITHFTDDLYQQTFEDLQTHYLILCNEEDMQ